LIVVYVYACCHCVAAATAIVILIAVVTTAVAAVSAASWMLWLKFVHVCCWCKDGDQSQFYGGTCNRGGVGARNANYSYEKRATPLDIKEGFGKLEEGLRKA
jgi:hypothetical protein